MTMQHEEAKEPRIVATGISEDDIFAWMDEKVRAIRSLKSALADREVMQQALTRLDAEIERLTNRATLEMVHK